MVIALHHPDQTEPCAALRRFLRGIRGRALALFQKSERATGCSAGDWLQIENELAVRNPRWRCGSR